MNDMAKTITMANFKKEVVESDKPVLLDFWASWCAPCRMLSPSIDQLSQQYGDKVVIGKVNIDEEHELAQSFGVMSIPSVFVIKNGKVFESSVGVRPKKYYEDVLDKAIG
jgi:thioredoxin 1